VLLPLINLRRPATLVAPSDYETAGAPKTVIPEKADQAANRKKKGSHGGRPVSHDAELYKDRNTVERCINKIKDWRGIATRYDKSPASYEAALHLRGSIIWIRSLTPAA
jgi:transposase